MISNIYVTFGSKDYLSKILAQNVNRDLHLFNSITNNDSFELVDLSNQDTIFKNPINYNVITHSGIDFWNGTISYINVDLDDNQQKIIDAKINNIISNNLLPDGMSSIYSLNIYKKSSKRVILTTWDNDRKVANWYRSKSADDLFEFKDQINTNYFETIYKAI
ncbi:monooxygenase [Nicoliella spurrieriana]|uniref:Monooxygenase n=1 Tax=Nicoliella spurrieriana TaxID=2925830 RepID=A0A976RR94_9LACO|nr:monooxygenase [Nicoliella spurrieriana]UQS86420.1 monooxygenase [Nicoliella spurrieriana]